MSSPACRLNQWALSGTWTVARHAGLLDEPGGKIAFRFHARDVNLVMGPAHTASRSRFASHSTASRRRTPTAATSTPTVAGSSTSSAPTS